MRNGTSGYLQNVQRALGFTDNIKGNKSGSIVT